MGKRCGDELQDWTTSIVRGLIQPIRRSRASRPAAKPMSHGCPTRSRRVNGSPTGPSHAAYTRPAVPSIDLIATPVGSAPAKKRIEQDQLDKHLTAGESSCVMGLEDKVRSESQRRAREAEILNARIEADTRLQQAELAEQARQKIAQRQRIEDVALRAVQIYQQAGVHGRPLTFCWTTNKYRYREMAIGKLA